MIAVLPREVPDTVARVQVARAAALDAIEALDPRSAPKPVRLAACFARWEIEGAVSSLLMRPDDCREARWRVLGKLGRLRRQDGVTSAQRAAILRAERELRHALEAQEVAA